ncbi:phosphopantetheine-binding protein, partial [Streptomyces sp. NPDC088732]
HTRGIPVDWTPAYTNTHPRRIPLPTYAFQHTGYWPTRNRTAADVAAAGLDRSDHPLLGAVAALAGTESLVFTGRLSPDTVPWASAAYRDGSPLPSGVLLDLAIRAGDRAGCGRVEELALAEPLVVPERGALRIQVYVGDPGPDGARPFSVHSQPEPAGPPYRFAAPWTRHATGRLTADAVSATGEGGSAGDAFGLASWPPPGAVPVTPREADRPAEVHGGGGAAPGRLWRHGDDVYAEVAAPYGEGADDTSAFGLHPVLLDRALLAVRTALGTDPLETWPATWAGVSLYAVGASTLRVRATVAEDGARFWLADAAGEPVASVRRVRFQRASWPAEAAGPVLPAPEPVSGAAGPAAATEPAARRTAAGRAPDDPGVLRSRLAELAPAEQPRALLDFVRGEAATVLGHHDPGAVDAERGFVALGFESLTALTLRDRIAAATGLTLPATLAYDHPTPAAMAGHLGTLLLAGERSAVDGRLADLESALSAALPDEDEYLRVGARLRKLAARWEQAAPAGMPETDREASSALRTADAEELFSYLDGAYGDGAGPTG